MLFLFVTSAILCGCSDEYVNKSDTAVSFTAEISSRTQTRATVDTTKNTGNGANTGLIVRAAEPANGITESVSKMTRTSTVDNVWSAGNIAVEEGSTVKEYAVDASGNITSTSPFYWTSESSVPVTSWYPYSASLSSWTVNSNQSTEANYAASDLLYATGSLTYGSSSNTLTFSHKTAKVVINVVKANDVTSASSISSVTIGASGSLIDLSGTVGSTGAITASTTSTGYITPYQTTSSTYAATYSALVIPQDMTNKQFIAITVGNTTYYYKPTTSTVLSGGYQYTYNITIPNSTTATSGEYYFSDGSWGTLADHATSTVYPIGIVFSSTTSAIDKKHGWTHGYAMALTNATTNYTTKTSIWSSAYDANNGITYQDNVAGQTYTYSDYGSQLYTVFNTNKDGYSETHVINSKYSTSLQSNYPAIYYAVNYGTNVESGTTSYAAPSGSSGWYLPSIGQWWDIFINLGGMSTTPTYTTGSGWCRWYNGDKSGDTNSYSTLCLNAINVYLTAVSTYSSNKSYGYGTPDSFTNSNMSYGNSAGTYGGEYYWSSSEYSNSYAGVAYFASDGYLYLSCYLKVSYYFRVRPVIAF
jgi:hypothetical protein